MRVTQVEIAERVGLDVSSVNKILNGSVGPKFRQETIARVLKMAAKLKYDFTRPTKLNYVAALRELVPAEGDEAELAARLRVSAHRIYQIRAMIYGRA
jgi:transcriptional regulator with XRE-family HTH domain